MDRQYTIGIIIVVACVVLLSVMAIEAQGAYDVQKVIDEGYLVISHYDYYREFEPDHPMLLWNPADYMHNITTIEYRDIPFEQVGPWAVVNSSYLAHDNSHMFINDVEHNFKQKDEASYVVVALFEYLRAEVESSQADNRLLNNTIRQQAAHVAQLQAIIFDMGKDIGAMNNTINELQANMTSMKKEMQGIAPLN